MPKIATNLPLDSSVLTLATYNPDRLLDHIKESRKLKNDAALSRDLQLAPPVISKIRNRRLPITANILLRMHDVTEQPVNKLRELMGVAKFSRD